MDIDENSVYRLAADAHAIVSIADVKGNILHANDKFCSITGYRREELIGQNHRIVKSDEHDPDVFKSMWRDIARGKIWHGEIKNRRKDGDGYWVKTTIVPVLNNAGKPCCYVGIRTDITDRKKVETKLRNSSARLKHALAVKTAFMTRMNHEIRTPLNGISGLTDVLADTDLCEEQSELLSALRESSDRLMHLLENLLDIENPSAIEKPNPTAISQARINASLKEKWQAVAQDKGVAFGVGFGADLPDVLYFDFDILERILNELIKNAFTFTNTGGVTVHIRNGSSRTVVSEVSDTGAGISKDAFTRIFEPFEQEDSSLNRAADGAGLGLALCKELVEGLGGTITVTSEKNQGSTFSVGLPVVLE